MKAFLLGSGSLATTERNYTSLLVKAGDKTLLFDCGGSPFHTIPKIGCNPIELEAVFLTHSHTDHIYALPILFHELLLRKRDKPLELFFPEPAQDIMETILPTYFKGEVFPFSINFHPIKSASAETIIDEKDFQVLSAPVKHGVPTLAYKLIEKGKTLVYAPDTCPCPDLVKFAQDAEVLCHDCTYVYDSEKARRTGHSTLFQAIEIARQAQVKKLVLIHLGPGIDEEISKALAGISSNVIVGYDFLTFDI